MNECVVLVDNSNIYIEGTKHSARLRGVHGLTPDGKEPQDPSWRINFNGLLTYLADGRTIYHALLVGSKPPPNDGLWKSAEDKGFEVKVYARDSNNQEKAVDTELAVQGTLLITSTDKPMTLVIASGDRDFIPLVNAAHAKNWTVEMCAFSTAYSNRGEMANAVDVVRPLDQGFSSIGYNDYPWP